MGVFFSQGLRRIGWKTPDGKASYPLGDSKGLCRINTQKTFLSHRHKTQIIYCYKALFTKGHFLHFIVVCKRLPDVRPISLALQISSQAAFYWKAGNSCLSFVKNAFLYLFRHYSTSELYKHLGGTGSLVETFHSSIDSFLEQEASAQRSWYLGTAATGSSGSVIASGGTLQSLGN